ncbi:MAG: hypothetical protein R3E79_15805 [Caldilineaceae bacterium]
MNEQEEALLAEMTNRYAGQQLPWNAELPPPEVLALVDVLPPGRMLDLGCGLRACRYQPSMAGSAMALILWNRRLSPRANGR